MSADLTILACQTAIRATHTTAERDENRSATIGRIRAKLAQGRADIVVLPELSTVSYDRETFGRLDQVAEALDGPSFAAFSELARAHETVVVFGMPRIDGDEMRISQVVVGPDGALLGYFDKLHTAQFGFSEEKDFFAPGHHVFTFESCGVHIAPLVCYDIRFPELARRLVVDHGAQLILHCGAYARDESFDSWHAFVTTRAMENQVYMLSLNRAGPDFGASLFCSPWVDAEHGPIAFPAAAESFEYLTVDLEHLAEVRRRYGFLRDRLPSYAALPHSQPG